MSSGFITISVRLAGNDSFAILEGPTSQEMKYDDNSRNKQVHRDATIERAKERRDRWQANYGPYRDASFRIEDTDNETRETKVISGVPYDRPEAVEVKQLREHFTKVAHNTAGKPRKNAENLANHLFMLAEMGKVPGEIGAAWHTLSLGARVELCREVAAGFYVPAVAS